MATIKFKTNAKCGGCVAAIGAKLNTLYNWQNEKYKFSKRKV